MVIEVVLDWLENKDQYARSIAHLAGLKTAQVEGLRVEVAANWDGVDFQPPVFCSLPTDVGRISWAQTTSVSPLYERTLVPMTETFREMALPQRMVIMGIILANQTKKPHFQYFKFRKDPFPVKDYDEIWLRRQGWNAQELEKAVKDLMKLKRKLRGLGYA